MTRCIAVDRCRCNDIRPNCGHIIKPLAIRRRSPNTSECTVCALQIDRLDQVQRGYGEGPPRWSRDDRFAIMQSQIQPTYAHQQQLQPRLIAPRHGGCSAANWKCLHSGSVQFQAITLRYSFSPLFPSFFFFFFSFFFRGTFGEENGVTVGRWKGPKGACSALCGYKGVFSGGGIKLRGALPFDLWYRCGLYSIS